MDENDIFGVPDRDDDGNKKMPFEKKYLIAISIIAVVLVVAMTIVGMFIGYSSAEKNSHSIVEKNPTINIQGTTNMSVGVQDVTALVENSVVQVSAEFVNNTGRGEVSRGSGVIITDDGYIITNAHVVANALNPSSIKVSLANGKEYTARNFKLDSVMDIAYIKIESSEKLYPAVLGDSDELQKGERVVVIGNPLGTLGGSVTDGILSALDREIIVDSRLMHLLQTNAEINPGNSGGGMFNMKGELIGIVNAKSTATEVEGIGFAIPINRAYDVFKDLVEFGYVKGRIDTGISPVYISNYVDMARIFGTFDGEYPAVYVYNVVDRLSDKIKFGDKIVAINNKAISSLTEYNARLEEYAIGDTVKYTLKRNGNLFDVNIKLQEYKGN